MRLYHAPHFLANFDYWLKEILFEQRFCARTDLNLFANWHCVDILEISTLEQEELFVQVPPWWSSDEGSRLLFALTRIVFSYHSSLLILIEQKGSLFRIAVAALCVYALIFFFHQFCLVNILTRRMFSRVLGSCWVRCTFSFGKWCACIRILRWVAFCVSRLSVPLRSSISGLQSDPQGRLEWWTDFPVFSAYTFKWWSVRHSGSWRDIRKT